tara:strand:- start:788 stop:1876 length:1089 start_codon:yes stop_codon:yes gene_type:complete
MPSRTIIRTQGGVSKNLTVNRDREAVVRTISRSGRDALPLDRTARVHDSDRVGQSRPLLSKVVGGAAAAYSLRDLNSSSGNNRVIRAHRQNDSVQRDFTAKEITNGTLTSWASENPSGLASPNNNAFVIKWYDQSGLGRDALITGGGLISIGGAPQIVNGGVLFTSNSKPSLLFNASKLSISEDITGEDFSVYAVVEPTLEDPSADGYIFDNFTSYGRGLFHDDFYSGRFTIITDTTSTTSIRKRVGVALEPPQMGVLTSPALQLISGVIDNTSGSGDRGSVNIKNVNLGTSSIDNFNSVFNVPYQENTYVQYIGAGAHTGSGQFDGFISELVIYTGRGHYSLSNRLAIEANISNQYGITVS